MSDLVCEVSAFLYHEARLLDELRFEEWVGLFAPDGCYWVPAAWGQADPLNHVSIYYENLDLLNLRVMRLRHPATENMRPQPRTLHQITNIMIDKMDPGDDIIHVYSAQTIIEYRLGDQRAYAGHCRHTLRKTGAGYHIVMKRVDLLNCDTEKGHIRLTIPF